MRLVLVIAAMVAGCDVEPEDDDRVYDVDSDGVWRDFDCDDNDPEVGGSTNYFPDGDGDGFGVWDGAFGACEDPGAGYVTEVDELDCDDADEGAHPGATEVECDGIDQDCDGADLCEAADTGA